jgi:hypothetical protein
MEHESHHHHHPHKTGGRWLDLALGVSAAIVSLVSLWLGLHSAHSMEKLVAANSYPYVELQRSTSADKANGAADGFRRRVRYMMENNGVGPARIEWVEFRFKGKPVRDLGELIAQCCSTTPPDLSGFDVRGSIGGALIRPGATVRMFDWEQPATPNPTFLALHKQMNDIAYSACYCSVFDECYVVGDSDDGKPRPVEQCTPPKRAFRPDFPRNK